MLISKPDVNQIQEALEKSGPLRHALETCYIEYLESKKFPEVYRMIKTHRLNRCIEFCHLSDEEKERKSIDIALFRTQQEALRNNIEDSQKLFPELLKNYPW